MVDVVTKISRENKYKKFVCFHSNRTPYDFNRLRDIKHLGNDIFNGHMGSYMFNGHNQKKMSRIK